MADIRLGTSGWSYKEWVGPFYPDSKTKMFGHYCKVFNTAEINSTFYAYPSPRTVLGWVRHSPKGFVFTAKLPQVITHEKKLEHEQGVKADLYRFVELMEPLQRIGKLPVLLIQLPPSLRKDLDLLEKFFETLPEEFRFAVEFRHRTWWDEETWKLLSKYRVANTILDEPLLPPEPVVTTDFAYIRWHGRGKSSWYNYRYSLEELKPWIPKVKEVAEKTVAMYGYFNNHFHGYAVENCLEVLEMLGVSTPQQAEAKKVVSQYIENKVVQRKPMGTLTPFLVSAESAPKHAIEELLRVFMDRGRYRRATEILDDELGLEEKKPCLIRAKIREYTIVIDLDKKVILHDCTDWTKHAHEKTFCKHLGKVFLSLPETEAKQILNEIKSNKDSWQFLPLA
jgi:uncharacterized protein YecE (DUF72 family)